jgi:hypothetical protein
MLYIWTCRGHIGDCSSSWLMFDAIDTILVIDLSLLHTGESLQRSAY